MNSRIGTALVAAVAWGALVGPASTAQPVFRAKPATIAGSYVGPAAGQPTTPAAQPGKAFSFPALSSSEPNSVATSAPALLEGYGGGSLTVQGGEYQVCSASDCSDQSSWRTGTASGLPASFYARVRVSTGTFGSTTGAAVAATVSGLTSTAEFQATVRAQDTSPNPFSFTAVTNVELGTWATSSAVAVSGFESTVGVTASGGEVSVDNGQTWGTTAQLSEGGTVRARVRGSQSFLTATIVSVRVGSGNPVQFRATTRAQDATPDAFTIATVVGQSPDTLAVSAPVVIRGIEGLVGVYVSESDVAKGAEILDPASGEWGTGGSISDGEQFKVRVRTPAASCGEVTATVIVGTRTATFTARNACT